MSQDRVWRSPLKTVTGSSATCSNDSEDLPLVDCPDCRIPVIKLRSKRKATYGRIFYKCVNNIEDDPTSCWFYKWENDYMGYLRHKMNPDAGYGRSHIANLGVDAGYGRSHNANMSSVQVGELDQQIVECKHQIGVLKIEIQELKQQLACIGKKGFSLDSTYVVTSCIGCMLGLLIAVVSKM